MKIKSVLMMLSAAVFMMACDKDENGSKTVDFAGRYNGYTLASCNYFQNMISADETVVLTKTRTAPPPYRSPPPRGANLPSPMHKRV